VVDPEAPDVAILEAGYRLARISALIRAKSEGSGADLSAVKDAIDALRSRLDSVKEIKKTLTAIDSTTEKARDELVRRFQEDAQGPRVFVLSVKAGGTGLNLTGADTVIHFDPWWNPAVEDQATARAHRIGQNKIVSSYKLIARDTVEEKIVRLQERKKELFRGTLVSEEDFVRGLDWTELQELLN
jgi:SNF2 family DNA or RNA helicase